VIQLERAARVIGQLLQADPERALRTRQRLLEDVVEEPETFCLLTPTVTPRKVRINGVQIPAYRFIYCERNKIALPWDQVVRHRCANRTCINHRHLEVGDRRDNKHDDWEHWAYGIDPRFLPRG
jgi:hypothetical protein